MHVLAWWRLTGWLLIFMVVIGGLPSVSAETRPIAQLPGDLVRWTTVWTDVPQQMYAVTLDHGPVAGLTWGPTKGTALMVTSTTKEIWGAMQRDERPGHRSNEDVNGPLFRYEF